MAADVRGQRAGVGEPVPRAAAVLGRARAHVPGAPTLPAAAASVRASRTLREPTFVTVPISKTIIGLQLRHHRHRLSLGSRQK